MMEKVNVGNDNSNLYQKLRNTGYIKWRICKYNYECKPSDIFINLHNMSLDRLAA